MGDGDSREGNLGTISEQIPVENWVLGHSPLPCAAGSPAMAETPDSWEHLIPMLVHMQCFTSGCWDTRSSLG